MSSAQQDQGDGGDDAQQHAQGGAAGIEVPHLQEGGGFLHGNGAGQRFHRAVFGGLRSFYIIFEQIIGADPEQLGQTDDAGHVRHGLGSFPFGDGLAAHAQLLRQFLLGPAVLFSQFDYLVR